MEKDEMNTRIKQHGENLKAIFKVDIDACELFYKLRSLEVSANCIAIDYSNGNITEKEYDFKKVLIEVGISELLGFQALDMIFVDSEPRGYSLKIESELAKDMKIYRDMGGYGILAPFFG